MGEKERDRWRERERESEREHSHTLIYSLNACNCQGWTMIKPTELSPALPCGWQKHNPLSHHPLPPRVIRVHISTKLKPGVELGLGPRYSNMEHGCLDQCLTNRPDTCPQTEHLLHNLLNIKGWGYKV